MGRLSRSKGRAAEQQVVLLARAVGLPARRCWANAAHPDAGERVKDVEIAGQPYQVQVAHGGFGRMYRELEGVRGFIFRRDRREWLVALRLEDYFRLLLKWKSHKE